jgi:hypothetical protein
VPWADGMTLEDYLDAVAFRAGGVPNPNKWVDELREKAREAKLRALLM